MGGRRRGRHADAHRHQRHVGTAAHHLPDRPAPAPGAARRAAAAPPPSKRNSGLRALVALLVVLALAAAGVAGYQALNGSGTKSVQLRNDVKGQAQDAIEQLRGLIEDNTQ